MSLRIIRPALCGLLISGCTGTVETHDGAGPVGPNPSGQPGSGGGGPGGGSGPGGGGGGGLGGDDNENLPPLFAAPAARVGRLTHSQWDATVRDLFRLEASSPNWASSFRSDPNQGGFIFDNGVDALVVDETLQAAYRRAAENVANYVTEGDGTSRLAGFLPDTGSEDERARALAESLGMRAHRRPLSEAEIDAYMAVYQVGRTHPMGAPEFVSGIRLMIQAMLNSPQFLYRIELSESPSGNAIPLDNYELASRLSYFLWNTMPDDALFDAAREGRLTEADGIRTQAERMLADPRATAVSYRFHEVLLDMARYNNISPATDEFPNIPSNLSELARRETELVMQDAFENDIGWRELMTTTDTWVNQELASVYGLEGSFGAEFQKVSLDPAERRGLFTQIGFLTAHSTAYQPDPIHRGVFLTEKIACNPLGAPPAELPPLPPPQGRTNRELVADHTEQPGSVCASCHTTLINPFGFAYENYDAAGQIRTIDNGQPVDTRAEPLFGGETVVVQDALELADELANNDAVHRCYAEHWVEYAFGRKITAEDAGLVARLAQDSVAGGSIRSLLASLASSPAFTNRSVEDPQ